MDLDTAHSVEALVRMIDHVNSAKAINGLGTNIAVAVASSLRSTGSLTDQVEALIEQFFREFDSITASEPYDGSRKMYEAARALWDASKQK
jgi:UTP:GlnB (protein PII) uridylyltransferase